MSCALSFSQKLSIFDNSFSPKNPQKNPKRLGDVFSGLGKVGFGGPKSQFVQNPTPKTHKTLSKGPTFLFHDFILVIHKEVTHAEKHCEDHWPSNCHRFLILLGQAATSATFCALGFQERLWLKKKVMKLSEDIRFFWFQRLNQHPEFGEMAWNVDNGCVKLPVLGKGMERWWKVLFFKDA